MTQLTCPHELPILLMQFLHDQVVSRASGGEDMPKLRDSREFRSRELSEAVEKEPVYCYARKQRPKIARER